MRQPYTHGRWVAKEGREAEFQAAWEELAEWTARNIPGAVGGEARLLQDIENPRLFYSFGPWQSLEAIEAWRASAGFQERVGQVRELLEAFEAHTLDLVAQH